MGSPMDHMDLTPIQKFYSNSKIFITGATGFFGRILLEKLLRSCLNVSTIYILIRQKKGKDSKMRIRDILEDVPFQRLRAERPDFGSKVVGIDGDCSLPNLGLSSSDMEILRNEVDVIFHLAATVNFTEKLKTATFTNIRATRDLLALAREMPNLRVLMHVSTAFANCVRKVLEEKIYPPALNGHMMISMAEYLPDRIFDQISDLLLGEYPNTYTLTKQIAEGVIKENGHGLPIGIHRPAIAVSTYKEPIKSWINNIYSATGLVTYAALGVLRTVYGDPNAKSNAVPIDMCMNSLIAAAWDVGTRFQTARKQKKEFEIPIYHYESNSENPITWDEFFGKALYYSKATPSTKTMWIQCNTIRHNLYTHTLYQFFLHTVPAFIMDVGSVFIGRKPTMLKMYSKLHRLNEVASYFSTQEWTYKSKNTRKLLEKMSERDRQIFFSDVRHIDWNEFFKTYFYGIRLYLLKDPKETIPDAKKKLLRLYWAHQFLSVSVGLCLMWMMWFILKRKMRL